MRRTVILTVPEGTEALYVECLADGRRAWIDQTPTHIEKHKPVLPDDQLTHDLDMVTKRAIDPELGWDQDVELAAYRVRAAAGLDDE